jgi:hypothetical protein
MVTGKKRRMACPDCGKPVSATGPFAFKGYGDPAKHNCPHGRPCYGVKGFRPQERCADCARKGGEK